VSTRALVLCVEDNVPNFALVRKVLEATGRYEVERAATAAEALAALEQGRYALILLDLDLPDRSGIEVAKAVRADPRLCDVPIVAVSASVLKHERTQAMEAGCVAFVEKPFDIDEFRQVVDRAAAPAT